MSYTKPVLAFALGLIFAATAGASAQTGDAPPHLARHGSAEQLIVQGHPYLVLGGELHNSSSSSLSYMQPVWGQMAAMHLNTLLLPVAWESIEPTEGQYDFTLVDGLLEQARAQHMHIVFLWFGAWKNTFSSYVPAWVKENTQRFPRVQTSDGRPTERLSPFSPAVDDADARVFAKLMAHLREQDTAHTVLMVQVENEVGVIPQSRDHSPVAEKAFAGPVPATLLHYLEQHRGTLEPELRAAWEGAGARTAGTWQQVFGTAPYTDNLFMAWHYAVYTQEVTAAGKAAYPLPMYANAALIRPNYEPGQYNSGGPLPQNMDVWRAGAPALDFFSPDIYFNDFVHWASAYTRPGNPLFIPEAQTGAAGEANSLYAFGALRAIGFSAFGIDDQGNAPLDLVGITKPGEHLDSNALSAAYRVLAALSPQILEGEANGGMGAALIEGDAQRSARLAMGDYTATVTRAGSAAGQDSRIGILYLQTGPSEFLVMGSGDAQLTFSSEKPGPAVTGILSIDEELLQGNSFVQGRRLNGDESGQGQNLRIYADDLARGRIYRLRLYRY